MYRLPHAAHDRLPGSVRGVGKARRLDGCEDKRLSKAKPERIAGDGRHDQLVRHEPPKEPPRTAPQSSSGNSARPDAGPAHEAGGRGPTESDDAPQLVGRQEMPKTVGAWNPYKQRWVEAIPDAQQATVDDRSFKNYSLDPRPSARAHAVRGSAPTHSLGSRSRESVCSSSSES